MLKKINHPFKIGEVWAFNYTSSFSDKGQPFTIIDIKEETFEILNPNTLEPIKKYNLVCVAIVDDRIRKFVIQGISSLIEKENLIKIC